MSDEFEIEDKLLSFAAHNSLLFNLMREGHIDYPEREVTTFIFEQLENFFDEFIPIFAKNLGKDGDYLQELYNVSITNINKLLEDINKNKDPAAQVRVIMKSQKLH
jgi:hypothetical protein